MSEDRNNNIPMGQKWREHERRVVEEMDPALRKTLTLEYLDEVLGKVIVDRVIPAWENDFRKLFNVVSRRGGEAGDRAFLRALFQFDPDTGASFSPTCTMPLLIEMEHVRDVTSDDIRGLSAFRIIHQRAEALDYAVRFEGLTSAEAQSHGFSAWPKITFDARKSYEEGRAECPDFYPAPGAYIPLLGPAPPAFNKDESRKHALATSDFDKKAPRRHRLR